MAGRGPARTPTKILKARGSPLAKLREPEPELPADIPTAPDYLDEFAKREWRYVCKHAKEGNYIARLDRDMLAMFCESLSKYVTARDRGDERMAMNWMDRVLKSGAQMGFSPASRASCKAAPKKSDEPAAKSFIKPFTAAG